jgi:hypothetical protein
MEHDRTFLQPASSLHCMIWRQQLVLMHSWQAFPFFVVHEDRGWSPVPTLPSDPSVDVEQPTAEMSKAKTVTPVARTIVIPPGEVRGTDFRAAMSPSATPIPPVRARKYARAGAARP